MDKLIDEKVNVWDVIDTYFRDEPYYKSQHQVDSFNEFIYSKENGIQHIIKRENPLQIFKGDSGDGNFKYQIQIYFGETLNEETGEIVGDIENIFEISNIFGFLAILLAAINIFGGFLVTQRMLQMYKKKQKNK